LADIGPGASARHSGGRDSATARRRSSSRPPPTGDHCARYWPRSPTTNLGRTRPPATISRARPANAVKAATEAPGRSSGDAWSARASSMSIAGLAGTSRTGTMKGQSRAGPAVAGCSLLGSARRRCGEASGALSPPGSHSSTWSCFPGGRTRAAKALPPTSRRARFSSSSEAANGCGLGRGTAERRPRSGGPTAGLSLLSAQRTSSPASEGRHRACTTSIFL
jgi:hypothetical protein